MVLSELIPMNIDLLAVRIKIFNCPPWPIVFEDVFDQ